MLIKGDIDRDEFPKLVAFLASASCGPMGRGRRWARLRDSKTLESDGEISEGGSERYKTYRHSVTIEFISEGDQRDPKEKPRVRKALAEIGEFLDFYS